ncbi:hypothetical protein [Flavobacterium sp. NKUCC04_CG]|uniref:hypothetical protein n=1 Tax=Flavobacterium sp. NKUCC04_CG TaxID=2842121 RepID=UPI001C5B7F33|nr:hypothetical protein [Flavobacterium sp. NKUCC04_CG]MBW3520259.1 hypothetical protein [Flavobacterium sp. NKUCC04_CG]
MKKLIVFAWLFLVGVACSSNDNIPIIFDDNPINQQPVERRCGCENRGEISTDGILIRTVQYPDNPNRAPDHTYLIILGIDSVPRYFVCNDDLIDKKFPFLDEGTEIPVRFSGQYINLCEDQGFFYPAIYAYFFIKLDNIEAI